MNKIGKKLLALSMTVIMFFSTLVIAGAGKVFAEENGNYIHVRVEGVNSTLFDENIQITNENTAKDLLIKAVGQSNLEGVDTGFVTKILGEEQTSSMGWMYYLVDNSEDILQGDVISQQKIKDSKDNYYKEMVWHRAKWTDGLTLIPKVKAEHNGNDFKISITEQNVMMGIDERKAKDVDVKVEGVGEYKTDENGEVSFTVTPGEHKVDIYKIAKDSKEEEYPAIVRKSFTITGEGTEQTVKLEEVIKQVKEYYKTNPSEDYITALSFNHINSGDVSSFKLKTSNNVAAVADNIMGIIAIGKKPYSYEGTDYVGILTNSQKENGKFVINENDETSITVQAEAMTALDMSSAKYSTEAAIQVIMGFSNGGKFEDVDSTTRALIALSKHKEQNGVSDLINSCLADLKDKQLEGGGYDYYEMGNSPYSTAPVIQALIAVGEDPLSEKWTKGGRNLLDALLACKIKDNGFEIAEGMGGGFSDPTATNFSLAAIADIYRGTSMYHNFSFKPEEKPEPQKIVDSEIKDIKEYYENASSYGYSTLLGLKAAGVDNSILEQKIALNNKESILFTAQDIMSIIAIGKNPRNYNGKNYINDLVDYIKNPKESYITLDAYCYSLMALDMASAQKEDVELALQKVKDGCSTFKKVDKAALAITCLSQHSPEEGIGSIINSALTYIKSKQLDNGAFTLSATMYKNGDSQDTAYVIEALIAAGQDPISAEWTKNGKTPLDALLSFKMGKGYIYESSMGTYEQDMYTSFVLRAFSALKNNKTVFEQFKISYNADKDKTEVIKQALTELKEYYSKIDKYDFREALSLNHSSDNISEDIKSIQDKYKVRENPNSVSAYAANIIGIIASAQNPYKYNGTNYVDTIVKSQLKDGNDKGKFVIDSGDKDWPTVQAYAILSLDMAKADYDKESAINALCNMSSDGVYSDVDTTAMVITALAAHKDIKEAADTINSSVEYLKNQQNTTAGYDAYGQGNNPCTISAVIQGLIANNISPLSDEWWKNGSSMVDALLTNKKDGNFGNDFANSEAFMALADLYKGNSMFDSVKYDNDFKILNLTNVAEFKIGSDAEITIQAQNNTNEAKTAELIVGLYDNEGRFVNYVAAKQNVDSNKTVELTGRIKLPTEGTYTIRAFVWDSLETMNPLSEVIEIPVK